MWIVKPGTPFSNKVNIPRRMEYTYQIWHTNMVVSGLGMAMWIGKCKYLRIFANMRRWASENIVALAIPNLDWHSRVNFCRGSTLKPITQISQNMTNTWWPIFKHQIPTNSKGQYQQKEANEKYLMANPWAGYPDQTKYPKYQIPTKGREWEIPDGQPLSLERKPHLPTAANSSLAPPGKKDPQTSPSLLTRLSLFGMGTWSHSWEAMRSSSQESCVCLCLLTFLSLLYLEPLLGSNAFLKPRVGEFSTNLFIC